VEALFEIRDDSPIAAWLRESGVGDLDEGQLVVRREVAAEGAGRVLLNGSPTTLGVLRELSSQMLELYGQHDPKSLLEADRHLELLDAFGLHASDRERVRLTHGALREARAGLVALCERSSDRSGRVAELEQTIREIDSLAPRPGELEQLERERRLLQNSGRTAELLDQVVALSYDGEPAAASLAASAASRAEELAELDPALHEPAGRLRAAAVEIEDAGTVFRDYRDRADFDPARLEHVETRRAGLEHACLRFATDEAGLVERRDAAETELSTLQSLDEEIAVLEGRVGETQDAYLAAASVLTRKRHAAARKLESAVERQFQALALAKARFRVELPAARGESIERDGKPAQVAGVCGAERAEFHLAANPGEPLRPLRDVASGGELSRVMLALHVVADAKRDGRVMVFDEIDTGVSGAVADAVGARLQSLARAHQLLCVTHLPQVAVYADRHFRVSKSVSGGRTHAGIADLSGDQRVEELARMLAGKRPTAASRRHASEMLEAAGRRPRRVARREA
jgi:DNA repair protein RecN (Recombination protein N)